MRILALETSELAATVAAANDDNLLAEIELERSQRSAQSLAPAIHRLLEQVGWQASQVELVALTIGPGSFTGLRIGVAMAKVFAYAVGAEVLGLDTLEVIAAAASPEVSSLAVAIDAQRGDVVGRYFRRSMSGWLEPVSPAELVPLEAWLQALPPGTAIAGPVLKKWTEPLPDGVTMLDPAYWPPRAAQVARLAYRDYSAGRRDDLWALLPVYSRPSAAEEKWRQREQR